MKKLTPYGGLSRQDRLDRIAENCNPDVLVIGGGINGIAAFRDLALQGLRIVLVDKDDYCSGASGALSRMVHGGLRYMETGEFKLVRESLTERNRLLRNAPHYVSPLPTTVPLFDYSSGLTSALQRFLGLTEKPSRRGAVLVKFGLSLYDMFTREASGMPRHSFAGKSETFRRWPNLNPDVRCTGTYYDAQITYPERLGLELIEDVHASCPDAIALNYMSFDGLADGGSVILRDQVFDCTVTVRPKLVVNAGGAWTDLTNERLSKEFPRLIGGTKGSHLIVDNPELYEELGDNMIYYENQEGRVCILFRYFDRVLIGSTDIRVETPERVYCTDSEVAYILESVGFVFPSIKVKKEHIVYTFAGVRPLPYSDGETTGRISRDHFIHALDSTEERPFPVLCLIGGKWTTFRAFGEIVADDVLKRLGRYRTADTKNLAIGGGRDYPADDQVDEVLSALVREAGVSRHRAKKLWVRYGTRAFGVAKTLAAEGDTPLSTITDYSQQELAHVIRHEDVVTLADLLIRRTYLAITGRITEELVAEILPLMAKEKAWTSEQASNEYEKLRLLLTERHGITLRPLFESA